MAVPSNQHTQEREAATAKVTSPTSTPRSTTKSLRKNLQRFVISPSFSPRRNRESSRNPKILRRAVSLESSSSTSGLTALFASLKPKNRTTNPGRSVSTNSSKYSSTSYLSSSLHADCSNSVVTFDARPPKVVSTIHKNDYTAEEKKACFLTSNELRGMLMDGLRSVHLVEALQKKDRQQQQQQYFQLQQPSTTKDSMRGLEKLQTQTRQNLMKLQKDIYKGILSLQDTEMADVYQCYTEKCKQEALVRAHQDHQEAIIAHDNKSNHQTKN